MPIILFPFFLLFPCTHVYGTFFKNFNIFKKIFTKRYNKVKAPQIETGANTSIGVGFSKVLNS